MSPATAAQAASFGAVRERVPVILNWGLGRESTWILVALLEHPELRDFDLEDFVVATEMLGSEHPDTIENCERHILPLLRQHRVRYVQIARGGPTEADGIVVLSDTREPYVLHAEGAYRLEDELLTSGVVPQYAGGVHVCSLKHKAHTGDTWIRQEFGGRQLRRIWGYNRDEEGRIEKSERAMQQRLAGVGEAFDFEAEGAELLPPHRMIFGFNRDEEDRIARARRFDVNGRIGDYPLERARWNMTADDCVARLRARFGVTFERSACVFCPFGKITEARLERLRRYPEQAGRALFIEHVALAMNPRSTLLKGRTLRSVLERDGNRAAVASCERLIESHETGLYRVRRVYRGPGLADRCVNNLAVGSFDEMLARLEAEIDSRGLTRVVDHGISYGYRVERVPDVYPCAEDYLTVAPAVVQEKARYGLAWFDGKWAALFPEHAGELGISQTAFSF